MKPWDPRTRPIVLAAARNRKRLGNALLIAFAIEAAIALYLLPNTNAVLELVDLGREERAPEPASEAPAVVITISRTEILVDGMFVSPVRSPEELDDLLNLPLFEALTARRGPRGTANIRADKQVVFKQIKQVMFTAATAGYGDISFATLSMPSE